MDDGVLGQLIGKLGQLSKSIERHTNLINQLQTKNCELEMMLRDCLSRLEEESQGLFVGFIWYSVGMFEGEVL